MPFAYSDQEEKQEGLLPRLWIYTNYDCNLSCSYCVAESFVGAERRGVELAQVRRLIDEAVELGLTELFLTGGEPFILHDIMQMISECFLNKPIFAVDVRDHSYFRSRSPRSLAGRRPARGG